MYYSIPPDALLLLPCITPFPLTLFSFSHVFLHSPWRSSPSSMYPSLSPWQAEIYRTKGVRAVWLLYTFNYPKNNLLCGLTVNMLYCAAFFEGIFYSSCLLSGVRQSNTHKVRVGNHSKIAEPYKFCIVLTLSLCLYSFMSFHSSTNFPLLKPVAMLRRVTYGKV